MYGKTYTVSLPSVQVESEMFGIVRGYLKSLPEQTAEIKFTSAGYAAVDNMFTISDEETKLALEINPKGKVSVSLTTGTGTVSDAFKSEVSGKALTARIDPRIFADLFGKVKDRDKLPMRFYASRNKGRASSFVISASTDKAKAYLVGTYYDE